MSMSKYASKADYLSATETVTQEMREAGVKAMVSYVLGGGPGDEAVSSAQGAAIEKAYLAMRAVLNNAAPQEGPSTARSLDAGGKHAPADAAPIAYLFGSNLFFPSSLADKQKDRATPLYPSKPSATQRTLRYQLVGPTQEQIDKAWASKIANEGDVRLCWIVEADLYPLGDLGMAKEFKA